MESKQKIFKIIHDPKELLSRFLFGYQIGDLIIISKDSNVLEPFHGKRAVVYALTKIKGNNALKLHILEGSYRGQTILCIGEKNLKLIGRVRNEGDLDAAIAIGRAD